jgi:hypothetical protein
VKSNGNAGLRRELRNPYIAIMLRLRQAMYHERRAIRVASSGQSERCCRVLLPSQRRRCIVPPWRPPPAMLRPAFRLAPEVPEPGGRRPHCSRKRGKSGFACVSLSNTTRRLCPRLPSQATAQRARLRRGTVIKTDQPAAAFAESRSRCNIRVET